MSRLRVFWATHTCTIPNSGWQLENVQTIIRAFRLWWCIQCCHTSHVSHPGKTFKTIGLRRVAIVWILATEPIWRTRNVWHPSLNSRRHGCFFIWYGHMLSRHWTLVRRHNGCVMGHLVSVKWGYWTKLTQIASIKQVPIFYAVSAAENLIIMGADCVTVRLKWYAEGKLENFRWTNKKRLVWKLW